ncbi:MAG: SGNH/GDSL hydrolase family protein [Muribaculaceae bacterium]|nr:SGNH/GDSL hydrolase family protein [Muribaculaceae bacterium]
MKKLIFAIIALTAALATFATENNLAGKTIVFLGDSYVKNHRRPSSEAWHAKASANLGMNYVNCGRNGSAIAFDRTKEGFGPAMTERYKTEIPDSADYIVIIAGHNDTGFISNDTQQNSWEEFCTALDTLLDGIMTQFPNARLAYVTPWAVDRPGFTEVNSRIIKACGQRGIPVLDMAALGVIQVNNSEFRAKYFQGPNDTAHLNAQGHDLLVPLGEAFIRLISIK